MVRTEVGVFRKDGELFDALRISPEMILNMAGVMRFCAKPVQVQFLPRDLYPRLVRLDLQDQDNPLILSDGDWLMRERKRGRVGCVPSAIVASQFELVEDEINHEWVDPRESRKVILDGMPEEVRRWMYQNMEAFVVIGFDKMGLPVDFMMCPSRMAEMALLKSLQETVQTNRLANPGQEGQGSFG